MGRKLEIRQDLQRHGPGAFSVIVSVTEGEVELSKEFTYYKTNKIFPLYKSLIATLRNYRDVDVMLHTDFPRLSREIKNIEKAERPLSIMLLELLTDNNINIEVK